MIPHHTSATEKNVHNVCTEFYGRLRVNANMRPYLWRVGTKQIMGIAEIETGFALPPKVMQDLSEDILHTEIWGDFLVCPIVGERLTLVRVEHVRNMKVKIVGKP